MEFFFIYGFWARHLVEVARDPFAPYTRKLGNLRLEGMFIIVIILLFLLYTLFLFVIV